MSTTSVKPLQTLKGVFDVPKMNHRRDFLRENKLSLRELQRVTNKNKTSQQQEQAAKLLRQREQHQHQQEHYVGRRSASQQRPHLTGVAAAMQQQPSQRSMSQQRNIHPQTRAAAPPHHAQQTNIVQQRRPMQQQQQQHQRASSSAIGSRRGSFNGAGLTNGSICTAASVMSRAESCDKEIQTEDIHDEEFLYDALKKCASSECNAIKSGQMQATASNNDLDRVSLSDPNVPLSNGHYSTQRIPAGADENIDKQSYCAHDADDAASIHKLYEQDTVSRHHHKQQNLSDDNPAAPPPLSTSRTQVTALNGFVQSPPIDEELSHHLSHLALEPEQPLSGRSRVTLCSTQSHDDTSLSKKRSTGSVHKLGSREDVRLPRYLEREKREKEELRIREQERDPNCPIGHFALTEPERQAAMAMADKKFKALINELNHMPMTTETLRIRNRKAEIEKELTTIEADLRIFSKPKVYVKQQSNYV